MSDQSLSLALRPIRTNMSWHGTFREPAFSVFTNPAGVYAALHRYLEPVGGNLRDLGVDNAVLSDAAITYSLLASGGPIVRVRLERLEVAFLDWSGNLHGDTALVDGVRGVLAQAESALEVVRADVSFDVWSSVERGSVSDWWREFVKVPAALSDGSSQRFSLHSPNWTITFEPAARFASEGLYIRHTSVFSPEMGAAVNVGLAVTGLADLLKQFKIEFPGAA